MIVPALLVGLLLLALILQDAFEVMLLPRRVVRRWRFMRGFFRVTWSAWKLIARAIPVGARREQFLSIFGPLSMMILFALWSAGMVLAFGLVQWAVQHGQGITPGFGEATYLSGGAFFTLGFDEVRPQGGLGRAIAIVEAGVGFGLIAVVIGYLPVLYQLFSRREAHVIQLDARAGSPPTACEMLRRHAESEGLDKLDELLRTWEIWGAELLTQCHHPGDCNDWRDPATANCLSVVRPGEYCRRSRRGADMATPIQKGTLPTTGPSQQNQGRRANDGTIWCGELSGSREEILHMADPNKMDAIALLKADHRKVEDLFAKFAAAIGNGKKKALAEQICMELTVHAKIEEDLFYPACEGAVDEDLLKEAYVEHDGAKVLIAEIEAGGPDDEYYDAKVKVLSEQIEHHIKEEEQRVEGLFAQARKAGLDFDQLGEEIAVEKQLLMKTYKSSGLPIG